MTQCDSVNINSSAKISKLKLIIKKATKVALKLSINMIGDSKDKTNFPHKLLLTDR